MAKFFKFSILLMMKTKDLIQYYKKEFDHHFYEFLKDDQDSLETAIRNATLAIMHGNKLHPHQHRWKKVKKALPKQEKILQLIADQFVDKSFDEIYNIIWQNRIKNFAETATYDTAIRIGKFLDVSPEYVYLHSGTLLGAKKLGINCSHKTYLVQDDIPKILWRKLKPWQIEDFLCVMKQYF
jgi:hypothetical protein